jgi:hypothetical protein
MCYKYRNVICTLLFKRYLSHFIYINFYTLINLFSSIFFSISFWFLAIQNFYYLDIDLYLFSLSITISF